MTYAQRWQLACALKQGYPGISETGAEDSSTTVAAPPPVFTVEPAGAAGEKWKVGAWGAAGGFVVGMFLASMIWQWESNSPRARR
jgi:hypothetical protein